MGKRLIGSVGLSDSGVPDDLLTTKGDTHGYSSTNARIPIGDDDQVLTADSGEALGLKWATAGGGATVEIDNVTITSNVTSTATTLTDIAGLVITIGNITDGQTFITAQSTFAVDAARNVDFALADDDTTIVSTNMGTEVTTNARYNLSTSHAMSANGSEIQLQASVGGDTLTIFGKSDGVTSSIVSMSVG